MAPGLPTRPPPVTWNGATFNPGLRVVRKLEVEFIDQRGRLERVIAPLAM
jgi:hypothetical protein